MSPQKLARVAAAASFIFGISGIVAPDTLAAAFGIRLDAVGVPLARLACASYIGLGILNWMARDLTDLPAWRAIAVGNLAGWAISAGVVALGILSGLGDAVAWVLVAMQVGFSLTWALAYARVR